MNKTFIIANWKMNPKSLAQAERLFNTIKKGIENIKKIKNIEVVICPPFIYLNNFQFSCLPARQAIFNFQFSKNIKLGAQNCHWQESGPYTGEVSPKMLKDLGCKYVIIGHSERRKYFGETDEMINKKLLAAFEARLRPILCVGENKGENAERVVANQLDKDLKSIAQKDLKQLIIAYEPVWAISTSGGEICSPEYAQKMLGFIRQRFSGIVIYGGSVNSKIASDYIKVGFDGLLVGGASLDAKEFIKIVKNAQV